MPFNINQFKSVIEKHGGPAKTNLFEVEISPSNLDLEPIVPGVITTDDLRFFCQQVSVPGINLETTYYKPNGIGLPESIPVNVTPDSLNCVFLLDNNHRVMTFFHRWINSVMNVGGARGDNQNGLPVNEIEYKRSYAASELTVRHYSNHDFSRAYEFKYSGVYPTQVSPIDLNWTGGNGIASMTVNFSYSKMIYSGFGSRSFENSANFEGSQSSIANGRDIFQVLSTRINNAADALFG